MAILDILHYPDARLRTRAKPVQQVNQRIKTIVDNMFETMYDAPGIGLAATQVNIHQQIVAIDISEEKNKPLCLINPKIIKKEGQKLCEEGCLSVPKYFAEIKRAEKITVIALDRQGKKFELEADELLAVCIQHELDHLKGKLFVDYLSSLKQQRVRMKMKKLTKKA
jgi:peptide deformylase